MKFLICPASDELINATNDGELFEGTDGNEYCYAVEFKGDMILISDTINRSIPLDVSDLPSLINILNKINSYVKNTESLNKFLYERLIEGASV